MDEYGRVEEVIRFLGEDYQSQPSLSVLAKRVGLSDHHFQRLFLRWAGLLFKSKFGRPCCVFLQGSLGHISGLRQQLIALAQFERWARRSGEIRLRI